MFSQILLLQRVRVCMQVLPRQTCMLFTHTVLFDKFPGGQQRLDHGIYGGELFQTILFNPVLLLLLFVIVIIRTVR